MSYEMNYTDDIADKSAILGMLNSTIADEYRAKVVKATRNGTYAEGIRELDQAECSAFVEWLGLTNADDIVADLVVLKSYTDEYKCPLSDLIELCIDLENENYTDDIVSLAEYNAEPVSMLVDIGDSTDDLVEISAFSDDKEGSQELSTTDEVECNSMAVSYTHLRAHET